MKPIAVLGCGPAGLLAAYGCQLAGKPVSIFSKPEKSRIGGAQFLHMTIPGLTGGEPDTFLTYQVFGDAETYRKKVYGDDDSVPFVSFENVRDGDRVPAWNLSALYDRMWDEYSGVVNEAKIDALWLRDHLDQFEMVLSTVPLVHICEARAGFLNTTHRFTVQDINIYPGKYGVVPEDTVVYDGTNDHSWYRSSNIFGNQFTEWASHSQKPPVLEMVTDHKPIATSCDCWPQVIRLGRRGTWQKGVLTHDAFLGTLKVLL